MDFISFALRYKMDQQILNFLKLSNIDYGTSISYEPTRISVVFSHQDGEYRITQCEGQYFVKCNRKSYKGSIDQVLEILTKLFDRELVV